MRILLNTESPLAAIRLRDKIIKCLNGEVEGVKIDTWTYIKSIDNYHIIYHNPEQYVSCPEKNVLFKLELDGSVVSLSTAWWKKNPTPSEEFFCIHVGRLTEMLLRYFKTEFLKFTIAD